MDLFAGLIAILLVVLPIAQCARVHLARGAARELEQRDRIAAREQADLIQYYRDKDARRKREHRQWNNLRWQYDKPARDRWQAERDAKYARLAKEAADRQAADEERQRYRRKVERGRAVKQEFAPLGTYLHVGGLITADRMYAGPGLVREVLVCTCEYITEQALCEPEPTYHLTSRNGCPIHTETP